MIKKAVIGLLAILGRRLIAAVARKAANKAVSKAFRR